MKVAIIFTLILIGNIFSIIPTFNFANSVTELSSSLTITVDDRKGWYYSSSVLKNTVSTPPTIKLGTKNATLIYLLLAITLLFWF